MICDRHSRFFKPPRIVGYKIFRAVRLQCFRTGETETCLSYADSRSSKEHFWPQNSAKCVSPPRLLVKKTGFSIQRDWKRRRRSSRRTLGRWARMNTHSNQRKENERERSSFFRPSLSSVHLRGPVVDLECIPVYLVFHSLHHL